MRNLKRLLTMTLAIAFMMSLMVVGAGAVFNDQKDVKNETAVNMNVALGIIKGKENNNFDPAGNVTRAEMAKMICVMLNGGNEPALGAKAIATYTDIKGHWAEGYIEYCSSLGIIAGVGNNCFNPDGKITGTQAAKMLLVALGYDAAAEGFNGATWAVKINVAASQKDLYKDLTIDPNAPLIRDDAAQMIWNALNAKMVKYTYSLTTNNGVLSNVKIAEEYSDNRTLLTNKFSQAEFKGTLSQFSYNSNKKEWTYTVIGSTTKTFTTTLDFTSFYGQKVKVVYKLDSSNNVDKVFGIYGDDSKVLFSGVMNDLTINSDNIKFNGKTYDLDTKDKATTYAYEFTYDKAFDTAYKIKPADPIAVKADLDTINKAASTPVWTYSFNAIDSDKDGKVDFIVTFPYIVKKVTYVGSKSVTAGNSYNIADCDVYSGIKKDDYTKITAAANTTTNTDRLDKVDNMVGGKVTYISGGDYTIDGKVYFKASACTTNPAVGNTVKDAVIVNGAFFFVDANGTTKLTDYAVVVSAAGENGVSSDQAKLIFTDGTKKVVDTDKDYSSIKGKMVTYSINSDKEYELKLVDFTTANGTGFDNAFNAGATIGVDSNKVKYLAGYNVADTAVIFVYNTTDKSYDVVTGAKLLSTNATGLAVNGGFANDSSASGYKNVQVAFITSNAKLSTADYLYGYATKASGQAENKDSKVVNQYTLWDGQKEVTVMAKDTLNTTLVKGDVVRYTVNSDGYADKLDKYTTEGNAVSAEVVAITAYDGKYIQLNGSETRYEIDKEKTQFLYIDNEDHKYVEGGSVQLASKDVNGLYMANAVVILDGTDVKLIVSDTKNKINNTATVPAFSFKDSTYTDGASVNAAKNTIGVTVSLAKGNAANVKTEVVGLVNNVAAVTILDNGTNCNAAIIVAADGTSYTYALVKAYDATSKVTTLSAATETTLAKCQEKADATKSAAGAASVSVVLKTDNGTAGYNAGDVVAVTYTALNGDVIAAYDITVGA